jgi:hypothetical protein
MGSHPLFEIKHMKPMIRTILILGVVLTGYLLEAAEGDGYSPQWQLVQFNPKSTFCVGQQLNADNFTIITSPAGYGPECTLDYPSGTGSVGTFQATCTPPAGHGNQIECNYSVGATERDSFIEDNNPIEIDDAVESEIVDWDVSVPSLSLIVHYKESRSEHEVGEMTYSFPEVNSTGWQSCDTSITSQSLTGFQIGGDGSIRVGIVTLAVRGSYNQQSSVTANASCPPGRRIKITGHNQLIEVAVQGRIAQVRYGWQDMLDPIGVREWGDWEDSEEDMAEYRVRGTREPQRIKQTACCN